MSNVRVLIVQRIFSNYRKPIFDALSEKYELLLLHAKNDSGIKQIETNYSKNVMSINYYKKDTSVYMLLFKDLYKFKPSVIIHEHNPSILNLYLLLMFRRFYKYKLILWGHGVRNKDVLEKTNISMSVRVWLAKKADAIILYGDGRKKHFLKYIPENKIFVAYNTINTDQLSLKQKEFAKKGKNIIKQELGIIHTHNIVFIGRLLKEKLLTDIFVNIIKLLTKKELDVGFHIIGEGPEKKQLQVSLKGYGNVFFHGSVYDDNVTGAYLYIADILLNPGYLGLSVNSAFAFGTPVFSFKQGPNGPFHSPEAEYIKSNINGYLAKPYDLTDLINAICDYLKNKDKQENFQTAAIETINTEASIGRMIKGFEEAINFVNNE